jgi:hypothetical protein
MGSHFSSFRSTQKGGIIKVENNHKVFHRCLPSAQCISGVTYTFVIFNIS